MDVFLRVIGFVLLVIATLDCLRRLNRERTWGNTAAAFVDGAVVGVVVGLDRSPARAASLGLIIGLAFSVGVLAFGEVPAREPSEVTGANLSQSQRRVKRLLLAAGAGLTLVPVTVVATTILWTTSSSPERAALVVACVASAGTTIGSLLLARRIVRESKRHENSIDATDPPRRS